VIEEYQEKLMRYILRISDIPYEDAENLMQDIFIKVYRFINEYDERYSFSSWIYRIAHNMSIDYFRKNDKHSANISLDDEEYSNVIASIADGNSPLSEAKKTDIRECVQKAINSLTREYKEAILLKCIE
jgi:RNA polymerase sigma-70 factor (ECF subfamily)